MNALLRCLGAAAGLILTLPGQSPLVTIYTSNGGGPPGGQMLFDLTVNSTLTIQRLDVHSSSAVGTTGSIEVYVTPGSWVGNEQNPAVWTLAGSGPTSSRGAGVPTPVCITGGIVLQPGSYGVAVRHAGLSWLRTNGNGSNEIYANAELTLTAGASQNVPWAATFQPRVFNGALHYVAGVAAGPFHCAEASAFGAGCGGLTTAVPSAPLLGTVATLQTAGIPAGTAISLQALSFTQLQPAFDLAAIGAPGCSQFVPPDDTAISLQAPTWNRALPIPASGALLGVLVYGQSAAFAAGINPLGMITSNGVRLQLGNVIGT